MDPLAAFDPIAKLKARFDPRAQRPIVLEIDLNHGLLSAAPDHPVAAWKARSAPAMKAVRDALRAGVDDDRVSGLVVHVGNCPLDTAQIDELGIELRRFGDRKPVIAWTESFGELTNALLGYRLASYADEIWMQPSGSLGINGVHLEITLLRGGLDKLGVTPEFAQRQEYKSAGEQFTAHEVSAANREMMQRIADSILEDTIARIAEARKIDAETVRGLVAESPLTAERAREAGLIDRIGYRDEVYASLRARFGDTPGDDTSGTGTDPTASPDPKAEDPIQLRYAHRYDKGAGMVGQLMQLKQAAIGVVSIKGGIVTGFSSAGLGGTTAGSDTITAHLRAAADDDRIKAVVLRVDSPGGSYVASDAIRREVQQLGRIKPVIASMGSVAASGGYFAAMGADKVIANPLTLTGSIGVVAGKFVTDGLTRKLGLVRESVNAGERADMLAGLTGFTEEQWQALNAWLDQVYADFTAKAAADRGLQLEVLEPLARGRVWTGADARERGLVDDLGGMAHAVRLAAEAAEVDPDRTPVRAVPTLPWLGQVIPAESSQSHPDLNTGVFDGPISLSDPESLLALAARRLGVAVPHGVLELPWSIRIR
ncbi:signal peptide peptidase SppA [Granulicoccus phenolivorans]|uniref:signal peptide peptidase SppA n=1 Tax=Granulicoccus phenolivorans TaxID=266854 RepID=UPI0004177F13|nr:signal peptide peptidase SppA [Granulicoccus phenolivorans]